MLIACSNQINKEPMNKVNSTSLLDSDDMISNLPDSILAHILSFLPTNNAVATGILSQRWKFLWTNVTYLYFCFPDDDDYNYNKGFEETCKSTRFVQFVNYVLLLHKPECLNSLSLIWEPTCDPFYVNAWIRAAVARNVNELFVSVKNYALMIKVPRTMFISEGLQSLELNCNICISPEIVISLPNLENLKLISVYFQCEEVFGKLVCACPKLVYLYIDMDVGQMIDYLEMFRDDGAIVFKYMVSSTSLRYLELYVHDEYEILEGTSLCSVELDAPSLEYIFLRDQISSIFIQETLSSLVEANVELLVPDSESEDHNYCNSVVEAVSAFECARALTLSSDVIWALSYATVNLRTRFKRLSKLEVIISCCYWSAVQDVIKLSDNLQVLTVKEEAGCYGGDHLNNSNWKESDQVPSCLSNNLKIVTVGSYNGGNDQLEMLGYILKHGNALKVMQICFYETMEDLERKFELVKQISKFPRKSPVCELEFC